MSKELDVKLCLALSQIALYQWYFASAILNMSQDSKVIDKYSVTYDMLQEISHKSDKISNDLLAEARRMLDAKET